MKDSKFAYNQHVSVDCAVFGFDGELIRVLLLKRKQKNREVYCLPGDLVMLSETLDDAAYRILSDFTGLKGVYLKQFKAFGELDRINDPIDIEWLNSVRESPQEHVVTVGYYSILDTISDTLTPNAFAEEVFWQPIEQPKKLAFDHNNIANSAWEKLRSKIRNEPLVAFNLLPENFTLRQLQGLYEAIVGAELDKRNFRKKIQGKKYIIPLDTYETGVPHKPARYYKFDKAIYQKEFEMGQWFLF
jgi:hypothetical protein